MRGTNGLNCRGCGAVRRDRLASNYIAPSPCGPPTPWAIVYRNGYLYVSDRATSRILEIDPTTGASSTYTAGVMDPVALAFDAAGNLYVATHNGGYLAKYNVAGQLVSAQWVPPSLGYVDIAEIWICGDTLYFTGPNAATLYAVNLQTGQAQAVADFWTNGLRDPSGLACDCEGKVYISNAGWPSIVRWDPFTGTSIVEDNFYGSITQAAGPYGLLIVQKQ